MEISEDDKEFIISKGLYRRQDSKKECYSFIKLGEMEKDFKYRPFLYPNFDESLDEQYIQAKNLKKSLNMKEEIRYMMMFRGYMNRRKCLRKNMMKKEKLSKKRVSE